MSTSLLSIGYCGWDHLCVLPRIPIDDKVKIIQSIEQGGGPSATAAVCAAKLGIESAFAGVVGDDRVGDMILDAFQQAGVDASAIVRRKGAASPQAYCWIDSENGNRSIAWTHGDALPLRPSELPNSVIRSADVIHLDGHQGDAALAGAEIAKANGVLVSIDAGTLVPEIDTMLEMSDIIIASEKFAGKYTGIGDPEKAVKILFEKGGTTFAGITLGKKGSIGYDGVAIYRQPAFEVTPVDTTGCGDTYHGAFLASFVKGMGIQECMRHGAGAAALKCMKLGGRTGLPTYDELENFLKKN